MHAFEAVLGSGISRVWQSSNTSWDAARGILQAPVRLFVTIAKRALRPVIGRSTETQADVDEPTRVEISISIGLLRTALVFYLFAVIIIIMKDILEFNVMSNLIQALNDATWPDIIRFSIGIAGLITVAFSRAIDRMVSKEVDLGVQAGRLLMLVGSKSKTAQVLPDASLDDRLLQTSRRNLSAIIELDETLSAENEQFLNESERWQLEKISKLSADDYRRIAKSLLAPRQTE
ncbi:MAG: hypothetical protein P4L81_05935 [Candidatus Pacebacteria bacterium]|nr:hypothetical protein [Candidatus Paceibacterota bacterium]